MRKTRAISPGQIPPIRASGTVTPGFLKTDGTPLIAGRDFTWTDIYDKRHVAMVSENLAREMWGSPAAAIGKRIRQGLNDAWREIVGVVADVYDKGVDQKAPAFAYWPAMLDNFELERSASSVRRVRHTHQPRGDRKLPHAGPASHLVGRRKSAGVPGADAETGLRCSPWRAPRLRSCCWRSPERWR